MAAKAAKSESLTRKAREAMECLTHRCLAQFFGWQGPVQKREVPKEGGREQREWPPRHQ